jgi:hypothetical protein
MDLRQRIEADLERVISARRQLEATLPLEKDPQTAGIISAVDVTLGECEQVLWHRLNSEVAL